MENTNNNNNNNNITYSTNNVNQSSSYTTHNSAAQSSLSSTSSSQQHQANNGGINPYRANPNRFKTNRKPFVSKKPLEQQNNVLSWEEGKVIDGLLDETVRDKEKPELGNEAAIESEFIESSNGLNSNDIKQNVKDKRRQRHGQMKTSSYQQNNNEFGSHSHKSNYSGQRNGGGGGGGDFKKNLNRGSNTSQPKSNKNRTNINNNNNNNNSDIVVERESFNLNNEPAIYGINGSLKTGSRKTNLNHLLNFTYESSRDNTTENYEYERLTKQFWSMKLSKNSYFSKEQFLQANCQFVVKNNGDYAVHMSDPDLLIAWPKIEEIHIDSHDPIACPICLYPPQAAKMTKCGHIYCWCCLLHYLSLSDKQWRKCPICFESIYKQDLKSVRVITSKVNYVSGDELKLRLMFKSKSHKFNAVILPIEVFDKYKRQLDSSSTSTLHLFNDIRKYIDKDCEQYFKLKCKSLDEIYESVVKREKSELTYQRDVERDAPEVCFVDEALKLLDERELAILSEINEAAKNDLVVLNQSLPIEILKSDLNYMNKHGSKQNNYDDDNDENANFSFFYQSVDGQRLYINSLNTRCLLNEYNTFRQCPYEINGRIVACESFFMSEENRKRFKYLSHLPLHSEFKIVELDLHSQLSETTLKMFEREIEDRKHMRLKKELKDKRMADRAAAAAAESSYESRFYTVASNINESKTIEGDYSFNFPDASNISPTQISTSNPLNQQQQQQQSLASFAQMLKHPSGEIGVVPRRENSICSSSLSAWPSLESATGSSLTSTSSSNGDGVNATTTAATSNWLSLTKQHQEQEVTRSKRYQAAPAPWIPLTTTTNTSSTSNLTTRREIISHLSDHKNSQEDLNEVYEDEAMPAPLFRESFFSAIDESLKLIESKKTFNPNDDEVTSSVQPKEKLKKKKKTKLLLFSTA